MGERAAGMAGAFTALSGDPSASPFYNPATTVLAGESSLSTSVSVYNKYNINIGESADPTVAPQRLNRGYFSSIPSSSASIVNFGSFAIGLTIVVPDSDSYDGTLQGTGSDISSLNFVDESLWVGGTFSARLTEQDSIGATLYYTARNLSREVLDRLPNSSQTGETLTDERTSLTTNSLVTILGYYRRLSSRWSIGVSYRPPSLPISGEGSYYRETTVTTPYSTSLVNRGSLRAESRVPAKIAVGFAREIDGDNTLSFDVQFYEGQSYADFPELNSDADHIDFRAIVNLALGYEQVINPEMQVRLGVFSNRSSHPTPRSDLRLRQGDSVDMSGFSANLVIKTSPHTHFTFGGYYSGGNGLSSQYVAQQYQVVPKSEQVFTMLVATGFAF